MSPFRGTNGAKRDMKLSKKIPARTQTIHFRWAYRHWCQFTKVYLEMREKIRGPRKSSMCKCDWCGRKFEFGEWIALARPMPGQEGPKRNWVLCNSCADLLGAPDRPKKEEDR